MWEKFKSIIVDESIFLSILMILVGVISFGLGRHSLAVPTSVGQVAGVALAPEPFILSTHTDSNVGTETVTAGTQRLVASQSGSRYHLLDCPSVSQIKESNKVFFATAAEAEAAGYTKAANCPGL